MENNLLKNNKRIDVADVLRGFAVMGIIILHSIEHFNFYSYPDISTQSTFLDFTDKAIWDSLFFLFGGKGYAIFALLFGFSFFIQDNNQQRKGKDFRLRFMWRLVLLFIIGNFNALFFTAEILVLYSIIGFVLVIVCRFPNRILFPLVVILLLQPMEWYKIISETVSPSSRAPENLVGYYFGEAFNMQKNGNFWQMAKVNLWEGQLASLAWAWEHGRMFQTAALFILGMIIGRKGLLLFSSRNLKIWGTVLSIALICYFSLDGLSALLPDFINNSTILISSNLIVQSLAKFCFMLVLVAGIILIYYNFGRMHRLLMVLAPYGRMSLTNYLTQSIIGSMMFYNWGFGLHEKLGITYSFLFGLVLFGLQLAFCHWWMKSHKQGPFEYLWKKGTWIGADKS